MADAGKDLQIGSRYGVRDFAAHCWWSNRIALTADDQDWTRYATKESEEVRRAHYLPSLQIGALRYLRHNLDCGIHGICRCVRSDNRAAAPAREFLGAQSLEVRYSRQALLIALRRIQSAASWYAVDEGDARGGNRTAANESRHDYGPERMCDEVSFVDAKGGKQMAEALRVIRGAGSIGGQALGSAIAWRVPGDDAK